MAEHNTSVIEYKIANFFGRAVPRVVPRDLDIGRLPLPNYNNRVNIISGMRRSGKTFFLYQTIETLLREGVDERRILYFNFDDDRLVDYGPSLLDDVLETFYRMSPSARTEGAYLFFDEIQEIENWGAFLRRVVDSEKATIMVTGSSSKLLSADIATEFRGRSITFELLPLSFSERLRFVEQENFEADALTSAQASSLAFSFDQYLERGGFPDVQFDDDQVAVSVLQGYARDTVLRDIIERYGMSNVTGSLWFATRALACSGRTLSVTKLAQTAKSLQVPLSRPTMYDLLARFEEAHMLYRVRDFTRAFSSTTSQWKVYAVDPGLFRAMSPAPTRDVGQALETAVYLDLRRRLKAMRNGTISYYKTTEGLEVDFIVGDAAGLVPYELVQASVSLADERTRNREIRALVQACQKCRLPGGTIVTLHEEEHITEEGIAIEVVPAWKWTLRATPGL